MARSVLSVATLRRVSMKLRGVWECGLAACSSTSPSYWTPNSNVNGFFSDGFNIGRLFSDGRPWGSLWRSRKLIGKEALFVNQGFERAKDDSKRFTNFMKTSVSSLLKADVLAVLAEFERQDELFLRRGFASVGTKKANDNHAEGNKETISVTFVDKDGEEKIVQVPIGMSMLEAAHQNDIELEGACEGSLACSTCHVIIMDENYYNKLQEPTDEENDMLDLAFGLTETSRLGCQVIAKPELDGMRLALPAATRNFAVDGYVAKPH